MVSLLFHITMNAPNTLCLLARKEDFTLEAWKSIMSVPIVTKVIYNVSKALEANNRPVTQEMRKKEVSDVLLLSPAPFTCILILYLI